MTKTTYSDKIFNIKSKNVKTNLFNIIEAVFDSIKPGEEEAVIPVVIDILNTSQSYNKN